jgi:hypothetical protein
MCFNAGIGILTTVIMISTRQSIILASLPRTVRSPHTVSIPPQSGPNNLMTTTLSQSFVVGIGHVSPYGWHSAAVVAPISISALSLLVITLRFLQAQWYFSRLTRSASVATMYLRVGHKNHSMWGLIVSRAVIAHAASTIVVLYLRKSYICRNLRVIC